MCHGGITRRSTLSLIERAHGRASLYVSSDIGAMEPGRWQLSHELWKIGATSLEKVTSFGLALAVAAAESVSATNIRSAPPPLTGTLRSSVFMLLPSRNVRDIIHGRGCRGGPS